MNAIAARLGDINHESEYLLNRFGFSKPVYMDDARSQLYEIEMDDPIIVSEETTIFEAWNKMTTKGKATLVVADDQNKLIGMVTMSNMTEVAMGDTAKSIDLLKETPIDYISKTIKGKLLYTPKKTRLNGKVSIIAIAASKLDNYDLKGRLVIVGNDTQAQLDVIEKDAACLVVVWAPSVSPAVLSFAKEKGCAVILSGHGTMNTARYLFYSSPIKYVMSRNLVTFNKLEYVSEVAKKIIKSRHRAYPVVDDRGHIFGLVSRFHLLNAKNKNIILVDHNEVSQSVENILEAQILEIVDHHRIGDIQTSMPINFRNQLVGSTSTIIAMMYKEQRVEIPSNIAGLLLGAMMSDTLNFNSPTTTSIDKEIGVELAAIANIDMNVFAKELFSIGSSVLNRSPQELIEYDIKEYVISNYRFRLGQVNIYNLAELETIRTSLIEAMEEYCVEHKLDLLLMIFTSIEKNGSIMFVAGKEKWIVEEAYPSILHGEDIFIEHVVSRKKQIIPRLSLVIENGAR
jgi:manganese-dependent inorganic pyrophosphatase